LLGGLAFLSDLSGALNHLTSTGSSLPQVSETANSKGLNRCLIFHEFVTE
jgi:hypothetical protein